MDAIAEPAILPLTDQPEVQNYLRRFSAAIAERPEAFADILERLGEAATVQTLDLRSEERETVPISVSDEELVVHFFKHRFDLESEYDETTEKAMKTDRTYKELLERHLGITSVNSQVGPMKHEVVSNPRANPARDAMRRARLAFFVKRTMDYQQKQGSARLPSAG